MKTLLLTVSSSFTLTSLSDNLSDLKLFVEIQLKNENLKSVFWVPKFWPPNQYTGLPNSPNTSLRGVSFVYKLLKSITILSKV